MESLATPVMRIVLLARESPYLLRMNSEERMMPPAQVGDMVAVVVCCFLRKGDENRVKDVGVGEDWVLG